MGPCELLRDVSVMGTPPNAAPIGRAEGIGGLDPLDGTPGLDGLGTLSQGFLEISNVSIVSELVDMIAAQRAYELNSKAIQTAEDMLTVTNQLKR